MKHLQKRLMVIFSIVLVFSSALAVFISYKMRDMIEHLPPMFDRVFMGMAIRELALLVSAIVIMWIALRLIIPRVIRPIVTMTNATKELAAGNFDVSVQEPRRIDEVGELLRNFNIMARELKSNEYLKKNFIANVSHEFKTPLAVINGYAELLGENDVTEEQRKEYAELIMQESYRLSTITENILRLSKLNSQEIQMQKEKFSLDEQLRQTILRLESGWSKKNLLLDIDLPETMYYGEEELLSQVWINLIDNAIKFSEDGGNLDIHISKNISGINVVIADTGSGMDMATKQRLFEPFFQGDSSHKREGSGLGLAIVKKIVDLHEGTIIAKSKPGKGTTITVFLPQ